jgi:TonB family protein
MRDRILTYAIIGSIVIHLGLLGLVGKTSAAKPIEVESLKIVKVDLAPATEKISVESGKSKPEQVSKPKIDTPPPDVPYVPPVHAMVNSEQAKKLPNRVGSATDGRKPIQVVHNNVDPGNPGGPLSGVASPNGQDLGSVPSGNSGAGTVPGADNGTGSGSGSGAGQGPPEPVKNPIAGSGNDPTPVNPQVHVDPPEPKMVSVTVCAVSGMLPGPYCEKKVTRLFKDGSEPRTVCNECKAPFVSRLADRQEPELVRDSQPKIPSIDEPGDYVVKVSYIVNKEGKVEDVEIIESSGIPAIDKAVRDAASKMLYKPAVQNGEPRSVKVTRRYRIRI